MLERGDKPEKGGGGGGRGGKCRNGVVATFLLLYSSITSFTLYVGKVKFPFLLQDSHPSLYSTKHYIICIFLIHSDSAQKMLTALFKLI